MIARSDVVWVDVGQPRGSEPGTVRPAVVVQDDWLLATEIGTVLVVPLTSNLALEVFPGNVLVPGAASGLDRDSVAVGPVSREFLEPFPTGHLPAYLANAVAAGIRLVTGI
ncbi:type II toxin-antitoxin system PemK/MazF family toxin [Cellulomonas sp. GbtcB1]|uniref:type II toxin-antitoxin system PemK/MazF family toxin n=1 Tax=Cellulomonas sp. GbtcB1 TaxID=2824746 RepID=UPI001C303361|nr:type II toxin-antitoxin system PemK/MazF family toxin [Cellulomonas sp. GbtcB1]